MGKTDGGQLHPSHRGHRSRTQHATKASTSSSSRCDGSGSTGTRDPEVGGTHGPYVQSERLHIYEQFAERLIETGSRLSLLRDERGNRSSSRRTSARPEPKTGFASKALGATEPIATPDLDAQSTSSASVPLTRARRDGTTTVKGEIEIPHSTLQDFILLRPDGMPLYNFGCVVDDLTMGVTLVARGDDHMINTAPQILLYQALAAPGSRTSLTCQWCLRQTERSCRSVTQRLVFSSISEHGVPPRRRHQLSCTRLGWSYGDQEIFTREELIEKFSWDRVGSTAGRYDAKKFLYVQAEHLRMLSDE